MDGVEDGHRRGSKSGTSSVANLIKDNNPKGTGGQFKRFGANEHYGLAPHVHQPVRNVTPKGMIFGKTGKDVGIDVFSPNKKDIKQLYEYLNNGKYHE